MAVIADTSPLNYLHQPASHQAQVPDRVISFPQRRGRATDGGVPPNQEFSRNDYF
jgi:hypothetical protein